MRTKEHCPAQVLRLRWLTLGVIAACYIVCRFLTPVLALPLGVAALVLFRKGKRKGAPMWSLLGAAGILVWMGLFTLLFVSPVMTHYGETMEFTATVTDYPTEGRFSLSVPITFSPATVFSVHGIAYLNTEETLLPGDVVHLSATLADPTQPSSNMPHYQRAQGVFVIAKKTKVLDISHQQRIPSRYWSKTLRQRLKQQISTLFSGETASFFTALLTGDQSALSDVLKDRLERLGMRHIIAVSGLHIAFLAAILLQLPLPIQLRQLLCVPVLVGFCLMTGAKPSVVRAVAMGCALLLASFVRRDNNPWSSLRAALFLLLLHNPFCMEDIGLQLSFLSVAGILLFTGSINQWLMEHGPKFRGKLGNSLKQRISGSFATSLGALSLTLPLCAVFFGRVSLISPLANLLTLWAVELGFSFGFLAVVFSFILPGLGSFLAFFARFFLNLVLFITQALSELGYYAAITSDVPLYVVWMVGMYGLLLLLLLRPEMKKHLRPMLAGVVGMLVMVLYLHRVFLLSGGLAVQVLNVGQGQSILALSEDKAVAIDCGGYDAGSILAAHMEDVGEYQLEILMLTHLDDDHVNGLPVLLEQVHVQTLLIPATEKETRRELDALVKPYGTKVVTLKKETRFPFGQATLRCFAPVGKEGDNNLGLSAVIEEGEYAVLVTGDMDTKTEERLLKKHALSADVLVVGHHGSATSTGDALLEAVHPKTAVISAGKGNSYGHPAEKTLTRLTKAGCVIRRTDREGTVTLKSR